MSIATPERETVSSTVTNPRTVRALDAYLMAVDKHPRRYDSADEAGYRAFIENRELLTELFWQKGQPEDLISSIELRHVKEIDAFLGEAPPIQPIGKKHGKTGVWESIKNLFHPQPNRDRLDDF